MSPITHLFAGVPASDLDAGIDWYTRFFGRPPDMRVGEEMLWEIDEHATLFIEPDAGRAVAGRITFAVAGLDALLERLAAQRIEHDPIETYSNGVRHVNVPDPDGNAIAFAEPPDTASASPRSAGPRGFRHRWLTRCAVSFRRKQRLAMSRATAAAARPRRPAFASIPKRLGASARPVAADSVDAGVVAPRRRRSPAA
jgi:catechol 2,3-dioxygenase-like lactoylglutathione lyase family enzyme